VNDCTGDVVHVAVRGAAEDVPVRLVRNCVAMDATYVSMSSQKHVTIANRSDVIVDFRWTRFAMPELEQQHKARCDSVHLITLIHLRYDTIRYDTPTIRFMIRYDTIEEF